MRRGDLKRFTAVWCIGWALLLVIAVILPLVIR
jgi:hypothetical protein